MKQIIKPNTEAQPLIDFYNESLIDGILQNYYWKQFGKPWKDDYKEYLLKEQGFICAYCMKVISKDEMKIEHLNPRHNCNSEAEKLTNSNMVAVCIGKTDSEKHCDTFRGDLKPNNKQLMTLSPTQSNPSCEELIQIIDGEVKSVPLNTIIDDDINKKLNLNCKPLVNARNATEQGFIEGLITKAINDGFEWTIEKMVEELRIILQIGVEAEHRRFSSYCLVEANVLNQKIAYNRTI